MDRPLDTFEALQARGQAAFELGHLDESAQLLSEALAWAQVQGDQRRIDLAFCNLSSVDLSRNPFATIGPETMNRLREILMRNEDAVNCRLAAYNLARAYEFRKEARKGLFYARIALDRSQQLGREDWIASSHNQIGNFLMAQSFFEEAAHEYDCALASHPQAADRQAMILINVGYSRLVRGDHVGGIRLLYSSLRELRRLGVRRGQMFAHIDLCFAHLELERFADAIRHGAKGLALAEEIGEEDAIKNALYLLGEARHLSGDDASARELFDRLERDFYPDKTGISEFLLAIDVRKMINLRA
ncbi:MAG TPA: hypothetical protein VF017_07475 [Thermoanaerobaculia bacterium]|nr:hypothetical protein [Thermoanaerobaculia bacterium]